MSFILPAPAFRFLLLASLCLCSGLADSSVSSKPVRSIPICSGVTLSANYLASVGPDQVPGFRFAGQPHRPGDQAGRARPIQLALVCALPWALAVEGIEWSGWQPAGCGQRAWPGGGLSPPAGAETNSSPCPRTRPGMDGKPAGEPGPRVQAGLCDLFLSWGKRIPGSLCLRLSCRRQPAGGLLSCGLRSAPVPMPPKS